MARAEEHREHVVPLVEIRRVAALADLLVDQLVGGPAHPAEHARAGRVAGPEHGEHGHPLRVAAPLEHVTEDRHQPRPPALVLHPEDRAHDHLERDALGGVAHRIGLAQGPALDLVARRLGHGLLVAAHALAMEGRKHQLALAHVRGVVEQQHGVVAQQRKKDPVCLAGVQEARVAGEDLLDRVGMGQEHPCALVGDLHGEHVAVTAVELLHHRPGPDEPAGGLNGAR